MYNDCTIVASYQPCDSCHHAFVLSTNERNKEGLKNNLYERMAAEKKNQSSCAEGCAENRRVGLLDQNR